jgi:cation-transporting ATPase 13A3/4/5
MQGIIGLQQGKVNDAGKVSVCCFDKTGTLTEIDIDVFGIIHREKHSPSFQEFLSPQEAHQTLDRELHPMFKCMAACHSVRVIKGISYGDSLDVKMMEFSTWQFDPSPKHSDCKYQMKCSKSTLKVLKVFEFTSEFQRMSVVTLDTASQEVRLYIKGSPEKVESLANR